MTHGTSVGHGNPAWGSHGIVGMSLYRDIFLYIPLSLDSCLRIVFLGLGEALAEPDDDAVTG